MYLAGEDDERTATYPDVTGYIDIWDDAPKARVYLAPPDMDTMLHALHAPFVTLFILTLTHIHTHKSPPSSQCLPSNPLLLQLPLLPPPTLPRDKLRGTFVSLLFVSMAFPVGVRFWPGFLSVNDVMHGQEAKDT